MGVPTVRLFGMPLHRIAAKDLVARVFSSLDRSEGGWIITANIDHLKRYAADEAIRALCEEADWIVADGMPLVWAARLQGNPLPDRVAGSDLVWMLAESAAQRGRTLFLLGGEPGVAEAAAERLRNRWPALRIVGTFGPSVSADPTPEELDEVRTRLRAARPDLVYCAFGAPKQERVIRALRAELPATWWLGVGISLSFIAGRVGRAPRWMQRFGLEWMHRLYQEPRRLTRRYLVDDFPFALRLFVHVSRTRRRAAAEPASLDR